jgi:hypothetical protein
MRSRYDVVFLPKGDLNQQFECATNHGVLKDKYAFKHRLCLVNFRPI